MKLGKPYLISSPTPMPTCPLKFPALPCLVGGTKLAGQHGKALGKQRKLLDDLLDIYNQEFQEGITVATFLDGSSPFSGIDLHPMTEPWLYMRNTNDESKLLKREAHDLLSNIEVKIEKLTRAKLWIAEDFERTDVAEEKGISEGVKTLLERQLKQGNKWRSHSMRYLMLIGVSPPINFVSEPQFDTASLLDPVVACEGDDVDDEEDVTLVFKSE
ncbi:hypothetical protein INT47_006147 [Mucor saturninus]|uniref:Uncharacterized protein n=1 Tax=Mucor saturninus TaxID=64648 RepID=A0A8H7RET2_9FUNG|nr:hypothetical protein INT47_006147 [Mucor saturninus]